MVSSQYHQLSNMLLGSNFQKPKHVPKNEYSRSKLLAKISLWPPSPTLQSPCPVYRIGYSCCCPCEVVNKIFSSMVNFGLGWTSMALAKNAKTIKITVKLTFSWMDYNTKLLKEKSQLWNCRISADLQFLETKIQKSICGQGSLYCKSARKSAWFSSALAFSITYHANFALDYKFSK